MFSATCRFFADYVHNVAQVNFRFPGSSLLLALLMLKFEA